MVIVDDILKEKVFVHFISFYFILHQNLVNSLKLGHSLNVVLCKIQKLLALPNEFVNRVVLKTNSTIFSASLIFLYSLSLVCHLVWCESCASHVRAKCTMEIMLFPHNFLAKICPCKSLVGGGGPFYCPYRNVRKNRKSRKIPTAYITFDIRFMLRVSRHSIRSDYW